MSPNSTLIAGIGTLLLAMGVGVLIGHLGRNTSSSRVSTPILTIPSTGAAGTATTPAATSTTANSPTSSSKSTTPSASKAASKPSKTATPPPSPAVKVGQKGTGKGYQHHKFTGHFFGGENEEEAGEESEAGKGSKSGSTGKGKK
jgi:cytoskeletal protein RodZ